MAVLASCAGAGHSGDELSDLALKARVEALVSRDKAPKAAFELREALGLDTPEVDALLEGMTETEPH